MQWAAALHGQVKMLDLKKDGHLCGPHPSWGHSSSNATWPPGGIATEKGRRNCLLRAVGNTEDTGQVPLFLASQLLTVFLKQREMPPTPHEQCVAISAFLASIHQLTVPYMQAQASSALKFPTIHQVTKLEQPKLLEDFWQVRRIYLKQCLHGCLNFGSSIFCIFIH